MIKQVWENGVLVEVVEIDSTTDKVLSRQTSRRELPCIHLGDYTGERVLCPSCQGHVEVKLRKCNLHKICTTHKKVAGIECCSVGFCSDYVDQEGNRGKPLVNTLAQTKYLGLDPKELIAGTRVEPLMGGSTLTFPFCGCCANPGTHTTTCCPNDPVPNQLTLTITNATGSAACMTGTYPLIFGASSIDPTVWAVPTADQPFCDIAFVQEMFFGCGILQSSPFLFEWRFSFFCFSTGYFANTALNVCPGIPFSGTINVGPDGQCFPTAGSFDFSITFP